MFSQSLKQKKYFCANIAMDHFEKSIEEIIPKVDVQKILLETYADIIRRNAGDEFVTLFWLLWNGV